MKLYQPLPFEIDNIITDTRRSLADCEGRYKAIKNDYGDFTDKTLIDLCCANGYFGFRFLQDGGRWTIGIDNDEKCSDLVNRLAQERDLRFVCKYKIDENDKADIGIYLDTHYHEGTEGYLDYLKNAVKVLYTSPSRNSNDYRVLLKNYFKNVEFIYDEKYAERFIYKCS